MPRKTTGQSALACALCAVCAATSTPRAATGAVNIHTNQVAYDARGPKFAVIESDSEQAADAGQEQPAAVPANRAEGGGHRASLGAGRSRQ